MTSMSAGAEASLRAAASPANPAPTITTLRGLAMESDLGFIDRPAAEAAIHVLCRPRLTGETFESSRNSRQPSTAQNAFSQTAASNVGLVPNSFLAPVF